MSARVPGAAREGWTVRVLDAGDASVVAAMFAVSLAEVAGARYVNAGSPVWSLAGGVADLERPATGGWVPGLRGEVAVERLAVQAEVPDDVPMLRRRGGASERTVIDVGWSVRELAASPSSWLSALRPDLDVLVAHGTSVGLRAAETALTELGGTTAARRTPSVVVVLASSKRKVRRGLADAGPRLRALDEAGCAFGIDASRVWPSDVLLDARRAPTTVDRLARRVGALVDDLRGEGVSPATTGRACGQATTVRPRTLGAR